MDAYTPTHTPTHTYAHTHMQCLPTHIMVELVHIGVIEDEVRISKLPCDGIHLPGTYRDQGRGVHTPQGVTRSCIVLLDLWCVCVCVCVHVCVCVCVCTCMCVETRLETHPQNGQCNLPSVRRAS